MPTSTPSPQPTAETAATMHPIAIIGMGGLFPKALNIRDFWRNVRNGVDSITDIPASHWRASDYFNDDPSAPDKTYSRRGGFLSPYPFDPLEFGIPPNVLEATDTSQLLGLVAARAALMDAGYASQPGSPHAGDQLRLIAEKRMRPAWRTRADVEANLESRTPIDRAP